jgi:hypothetical protein
MMGEPTNVKTTYILFIVGVYGAICVQKLQV